MIISLIFQQNHILHWEEKLKPWQYEKAWLAYSNKHFTGRFIASEMLLLKREHGVDKAWQVAKHYKFENLPIETKQGELFL